MAIKPCNILILDANQRSALAAVRSLGEIPGNIVHAADSSNKALAGVSRFCHRYHQYPSPVDQLEKFSAWLVAFIERHEIHFLLPMTEITSRTALPLRDKLGQCILPFAELDTVLALSDKWRLIQLASSIGIACPNTQYFANASELLGAPPERFPIVVKPCLSRILHEGAWISTSVHIAKDLNDLIRLTQKFTYLQSHPFLLQEYIPGHGAGIFALYRLSAPVTFFAHRRIREKPPSGGVSVLSESITASPQLLQITRKLLDHAQWHGVAMVEFRISPDGTPYLMEVNTRFWGSLQLAIDSGVDFPKLLLQTALSPTDPIDAINYKLGQRLRWLLGDIDNLYLTLRGPADIGTKLLAIFRFFTPHPFITRHEVNRWGDMRPALFEVKKYFGKQ